MSSTAPLHSRKVVSIEIDYPGSSNYTVLTYGPSGERVKIVETTSGSITSTKQFVGEEERNSGGSVTRQFFKRGEVISGTAYFYVKDHLGSVRELADSTGAIQTRYGFDLYGRTSKLQGSVDADFQFAGMYLHARSGLYLTFARLYNSNTATWLSRDPADGASYNYANGNPLSLIDPFGLDSVSIFGGIPGHIGLLIQIGEGENAAYHKIQGGYTSTIVQVRDEFGMYGIKIPFSGRLRASHSVGCKPSSNILYRDLATGEFKVRQILDIATSIVNKVNAANLPYTTIPPGATNQGIPAPYGFNTGPGYTSNSVVGTILRSAGLGVPTFIHASGANQNLPFGP